MTPDYTKPMDPERMDSNGRVAQEALGDNRLCTWYHQVTGLSYVIVGVAWNGDTDQWMVRHQCVDNGDPTVFVRSMHNFFGSSSQGRSRFIKGGPK